MSRKISIIVPCYNVEHFLDRCIQSLINQSIGIVNLELIFVNDASRDNTLEKLKDYEQVYPENMIIVDLEENLRQGGARNAGLQYASSDYIAFLDADDWIEETMYDKLYAKAIEYDCDMVSCKYRRVFDEHTPMGRTGAEDRLCVINSVDKLKTFILEGVEGGICCNIYKRQIMVDNQIFFPEKITYEDNYWLPLLQLFIRKYYVVEEYLYHYFVNMQSTMMTGDSLHHLDRLFIELMKIEEYKKRGVWELLHDEIEYQFIKMYFMNTLHILFTRFKVIPEGIISEMQKSIKECFPNYKNNRYIEESMSESEKYILTLIELEITQHDIEEMAENYRNGYLYFPNK